MRIEPKTNFDYTGRVPADKSVTHRAVMLNAVARGRAVITDPLLSLDTLATMACMEKLGATIERGENQVIVTGAERFKSCGRLEAENSGTTMRLLAGLAAGLGVSAVLDGDASLRKRPMGRVIRPLEKLGARISSQGGYAPLSIEPADLTGADIALDVPSAQVKSAVLLAGLNAKGETTVRFSTETRDHTERMLKGLGAEIETGKGYVRLSPGRLTARDVTVCGDISSAAYLLALGALLGHAKVTGVGVNPTRAGILAVFDKLGVRYEVTAERDVCGEPVADIEVFRSGLKPVSLSGEIIANVIDELPILAVLACFAHGETVITGAGELRVKESDRIRLLAENLTGLGAKVRELPDGLVIDGAGTLAGSRDFVCDPAGDHRIAMSMAAAGAASREGCTVKDFGCVNVSFPNFGAILGVEA